MPDVPRLGSGIPLVARSREMDRLRAAFNRAAGGSAGAVLIAGDAGVGKTRMVEEAAQLATDAGAIVLTGRCVDIGETGLPYLPFAEALAQVSDQSRLAKPALGMLLPDVVPTSANMPVSEPQRFAPSVGHIQGVPPRREQDVWQLQLFDAVYALLSELAEENTVVLVVEDLHWADSSTRGLLSFLLSRLRSQRLLVLCTYRTDDLHRRHPLRPLLAELVRLPAAERLELAPFDKSDARAFVSALGEGRVEQETVWQVADQSEGNAFFAEELLAALAEGDNCTGIPASLADVLLARVERLSEQTQQVIRLASVAGRSVKHKTLSEVTDLDTLQLEEALREAVQHFVFVSSGTQVHYSFRHALMREAVYGDLLPGERVRMHATYARYLMGRQEERGAAAGLAYHSLESNSLPTALIASVRAAKEATQLGAPGEALRYLEQALRLWESVEDKPADTSELSLLRKASWAAGTSGDPERAIAYARSAIKLADKQDDAELSAETRRRLALALMATDNGLNEASRVMEAAWAKVADLPPSHVRAWVLAVQARILRSCFDLERARERAERAVEDSRAVGAAGAEADALATLATIAEAAGSIDESQKLLAEAQDRAIAAEAITVEIRARFYRGINRFELGMLDEARVVLEEANQLAKNNGLSWSDFGVELRVLSVLRHFAAGDWDAAEDASEQPRGRVSSTVAARLAATGLHVMVGRGRFAETERLLQDLRTEWPRELQIALICGSVGAEAARWRGKPELAIERLNEAVTWALRAGGMWLLVGLRFGALGASACADLVHRAQAKGDAETAAKALEDGLKFIEYAQDTAEHGRPRTGVLGPEGKAWLVRGEAELTRLQGKSDPAAWERAVEAFDYGAVYEQALVRWRLGEALLGADRRADAERELRAVWKVAAQLGAKPLSDAVAQLARRARIALTDDGTGPRNTVELFTPREQSVLRLVALGQTNRQVGEELYISEKTVSVHLSRIMAKLGASRRAEAVAIAYDRGLLE